MCEIIYRAFVYYRLSKEDYFYFGHANSAKKMKDESNSITNQKGLAHHFLSENMDITLVNEFVDDGYTGLDYERPAFLDMMSRIALEKISCIIVKDFSRLGRDYLENCRYIERIFPEMGIRFIAINDNYDSAVERTQSDNIIIPFKNLMNENYSRDTSVKIRSHMLVKREAGDFIAPFAVYGYRKDTENANVLIPDAYASKVVADIFYMKIKGMSQKSISDYLNQEGILPPLEYKAYTGSRYTTSFKRKVQPEWSENMVLRILSNRVYTGTLEQGKVKKVNYKTNVRKAVPENEWIRSTEKHQPIIDGFIFDVVQHLLDIDTRVAPGKASLYPFCGLVYCADCEMPMIRKRDKQGSKEYIYYVCGGWKKNRGCTSHRINEKKLYSTVLNMLRTYIELIADAEALLQTIHYDDVRNYQREKLRQELEILYEREKKVNQTKFTLYEDYKNSILDEEEYLEFQHMYKMEGAEISKKIKCLEEKLESFEMDKTENEGWMNWFVQYRGIENLDRVALVLMVHHIKIYEDQSLKVKFNCQDEFENLIHLVKQGGVGNGEKK